MPCSWCLWMKQYITVITIILSKIRWAYKRIASFSSSTESLFTIFTFPTTRSPLNQYKLLTRVRYQITSYLMISSTDSKTNINLYLAIFITVTNHFYALITSLLGSQRVNICITSKVFRRVFNNTKYLYLLLIQYWTILKIQVLRKYNWVNSNLMQQLSNYEHQMETEISSRQSNKVKRN